MLGAGAIPVASDVSAAAVVDGHDGRDRAARHRGELGHPAAVASSWRPPEPVEDEQHDRGRTPHRLGNPRVMATVQQRRDDLIEGSGSVGSLHRLHYRVHRSNVLPYATMGAVKVSTRGDYAARALLSLALHESDRPTSVKEIAERTNLPQPYLEQILLAVKGAGLVRSKRGVGGGYVLGPPADGDHARGDPRRGRRPADHAHG